MVEKESRQIYFLFGCLGSRSILAYLAYQGYYREPLTILTTVIGLGFWFIYLFKLRKEGFEAGGKIWWDDLRPIHGTIYLLFSYLNHMGRSDAYILLVLDVLIGLYAWIGKK